jgi:hypothetical protein
LIAAGDGSRSNDVFRTHRNPRGWKKKPHALGSV